MTRSTALPAAWITLRILIVLNWVYAAIVAAILAGLFTSPDWTLTALGFSPPAATGSVLLGVRAIAALGLLAVPLNLMMLKRLLAMVETVRFGDPFVASNAYRMNEIAWIILGQQLIGLGVGLVGKAISTPAHPLHLGGGFSPSGWLAVVLTFVLARVFAEGTLMREDLHGTV